MLSFLVLTFAILSALDAMLLAHAGLYIIHPQQGSTCHAKKPCTVDWLDDGQSPLLTAIGLANVGLYTGNQRLVQAIPPVDVSRAHSLTFTPNPAAGPNSDNYYISFISTAAKRVNSSLPYAGYSPSFRLDGMTGSFAKPDAAATSLIPVSSSASNAGDVLSTVTVGAPSTTSTRATPFISIPVSSALPPNSSHSSSKSGSPSSSSSSSRNTATQSSQRSSTTVVGLTITASASSSLSPSSALLNPTAATTLSGFGTSVLTSPVPTTSSPSAVAGSSNSNSGAVGITVGCFGSAMVAAVIVGMSIGFW